MGASPAGGGSDVGIGRFMDVEVEEDMAATGTANEGGEDVEKKPRETS